MTYIFYVNSLCLGVYVVGVAGSVDLKDNVLYCNCEGSEDIECCEKKG